MSAYKLFTIIIFILLSLKVQATKVCFVKNRADADICVNNTSNRAIANYIIFISKNKYETATNVWIITNRKDADLKVYISNTPERIKVFFSENKEDGTKHTNDLHNRYTPGVKKSTGGVQKPF
jgi:hypothetical protein